MFIPNKKNVSDKIVSSILTTVRDYSKTALATEELRYLARLENLLLRTYLNDPTLTPSACRKLVQPYFPDRRLEDPDIVKRNEYMVLTDRDTRVELVEWAHKVVERIYAGMTLDAAAIKEAERMIEEKRAKDKKRYTYSVLLVAMFEYIPELNSCAERDELLKLGIKFRSKCLNQVLNIIKYDAGADNVRNEIDQMTDIPALRREVYLARKELQEYREMVEAADAEFEDKLEESRSRAIASFFTALNNEKYGFLIDSLYLQKKACADLKRSGEHLPYSVEGIPAFFDRLLMFLRDSGIAPASRFAPNSTQKLTLEQMEGCRFEPLPERKTPIRDGETVTVKVISSGWKLDDTVIAYPVLQEDYESSK